MRVPGPDGWQKVQVLMGKLTTLRVAAAFIPRILRGSLGIDGLPWSPMNRGKSEDGGWMHTGSRQAPTLEVEVKRRSGTSNELLDVMMPLDCLARRMIFYFYKSRQAFESVIQERSEPGSRVQ